jgi:hypothetical protein
MASCHALEPEFFRNLLGIFTSRGQLVKKILLQNDVKPDNTKDQTSANSKYLEALVGSVVEPGDDGKLTCCAVQREVQYTRFRLAASSRR